MRDQILPRSLRVRLRAFRRLCHRAGAILARQPYWPPLRTGLNFLKEPVIAVALVFASTTAIAQPFYVPSGSMEPTLQIGDEIVATKFSYGYGRYAVPFGTGPETRIMAATPKRGDIVVFKPLSDPEHHWVKRVIGLPGDRIQMRAGRLWINDRQLPIRADGTGVVENSYGVHQEVPRFIETLPNGVEHPIFKWRQTPYDDTEVFTVPKDHLFLMGDNRDDSFDSRVPLADGGIGFVPMDNLVGRARVVLGSWDFLDPANSPAGPFGVRLSRFFARVH